MFRFSCELVRARLMSPMAYSHWLPGKFASLLHPTAADEEAGAYDPIKDWWHTLLGLETGMHRDKERADFIGTLVFPLLQWVRELLVLLSESNFAPREDVDEEIRLWLGGFLTTKPCEDMFNSMTELGATLKGGVMSETSTWHRQVTATILQDADRPDLSISASAEAKTSSVKHIPKHIFDATLAPPQCSLGDETLATLAGDPPSWPSPSPLVLKQAPVAWEAAVQLGGNFSEVRKLWHSLLAERRAMLYHPLELQARAPRLIHSFDT